MSSGVPRSRKIAAASRVRSELYDEIPTYTARPERTAVSNAAIVSSSGVVRVESMGVEDVDVVQAHPGQRLVQ